MPRGSHANDIRRTGRHIDVSDGFTCAQFGKQFVSGEPSGITVTFHLSITSLHRHGNGLIHTYILRSDDKNLIENLAIIITYRRIGIPMNDILMIPHLQRIGNERIGIGQNIFRRTGKQVIRPIVEDMDFHGESIV